MCEPDHPLCIDDYDQRHAAQLEYVDLLSVSLCDIVVGIRQADEGQALLTPISAKGICCIRTDSQYLGAPDREFDVIIPQARQLRAAIWSEKPTQEREHNVPAPIVRKTNESAVCVAKLKIRSALAGVTSVQHIRPIPWRFSRSHRTWEA